jgi:hypothetical protein
MLPKSMDHIHYIFFNYFPAALIKLHRHVVRDEA